MKCPNCREELTHRYDICLNCGKQIWKSPRSASEEMKKKQVRFVLVVALLLVGAAFIFTSFAGGPTGSGSAPYVDFTTYQGDDAVAVVSDATGDCPTSCDDGKACTRDFCGPDTGYTCSHTQIAPCCGNGRCEEGETRDSCSGDCGQPISCGNGVCDSGETCSSCKDDCGCAEGVACVRDSCVTIACFFSNDCDDNNNCTNDVCNNAGTIDAVCAHEEISTCNSKTKDGCCPATCDRGNDADCEYYCDEEGNCSVYQVTKKE